MTTFILINDIAYACDTEQEIETAQNALREAGLAEAPVHVGEPDGLGDSYLNGQILHASAPERVVDVDALEALRAEASAAGDGRMAFICARALAGDKDAIGICADALDAAAAMADAN